MSEIQRGRDMKGDTKRETHERDIQRGRDMRELQRGRDMIRDTKKRQESYKVEERQVKNV